LAQVPKSAVASEVLATVWRVVWPALAPMLSDVSANAKNAEREMITEASERFSDVIISTLRTLR
jgi:hypothetical protein